MGASAAANVFERFGFGFRAKSDSAECQLNARHFCQTEMSISFQNQNSNAFAIEWICFVHRWIVKIFN